MPSNKLNTISVIAIISIIIIVIIALLLQKEDTQENTANNTTTNNEKTEENTQNNKDIQESVIIRFMDGKYTPETVSITAGQTVTWVNEDKNKEFWPATDLHPTHKQYPGSDIKKCNTQKATSIFDACKPMQYKETYSFKFTNKGQWQYHDHIHPRAKGTVVVEG